MDQLTNKQLIFLDNIVYLDLSDYDGYNLNQRKWKNFGRR